MADDAEKPSRDYRETVFLPDTPFPMRAGLPQKEPQILARWAEIDLYNTIRKARQDAGAPLFVLHDGPPYANGAIHIGHALQKTLKDFVVRSRFALGYDVDYVPGWDCHGLPIEWKIEEELRGQSRRKDEVSKAEFRTRCREYAEHWIGVQMEASSAWACSATGRTATPPWTIRARRPSSPSSTSSWPLASSTVAPSR